MLTLYHVCNYNTYTKFQRNKTLIGTTKYSSEKNTEFIYAYRWMINQMVQRLPGVSKNINYKYRTPVWAWYIENGNNTVTIDDVRDYDVAGTKMALIAFQKPKSEVLLSDFYRWHVPLNWAMGTGLQTDGYLSITRKEYRLFEAFRKYLSANELDVIIKKSWERIFDIDLSTAPDVQACVWDIKYNEVVNVEHFVTETREESE